MSRTSEERFEDWYGEEELERVKKIVDRGKGRPKRAANLGASDVACHIWWLRDPDFFDYGSREAIYREDYDELCDWADQSDDLVADMIEGAERNNNINKWPNIREDSEILDFAQWLTENLIVDGKLNRAYAWGACADSLDEDDNEVPVPDDPRPTC